MDELSKLAQKYGADKWGKHHYTPVYYEMFKDQRDKVLRVLEIGIGEGASLRMWQEFFPNAVIYGADIDPSRYVPVGDDSRIKIIKMDQSSGHSIRKSLAPLLQLTSFSLIIDDGSHRPSDQIFTASLILPYMSWFKDRKAFYVIEDIAETNDIAVILGDYQKYDVEFKKCGKRYDDELAIIKPIK